MRLKSLFLIFGIFITVSLSAQYDSTKKFQNDPEFRIGKLSNGITYYIRQNNEPKGRASFYIMRNVGALLETDEQNGLAHFLEHMAFNGTKHFPGKELINSLEKQGVSFGRNINAYTAYNETVYSLTDIPTLRKSLLDTCLLILSDWSSYLTLDENEINAERGVISEEWRTRRNVGFRLQNIINPVLMKGSRYAERDIIGSLDVIQNAKPGLIRDFYHKWYRPDLEGIAVVGDFDVNEMEKQVRKMFSEIPAANNPEKRPFFEIPSHKETYYVLAKDKEAQNSSISINTILRKQPSESEMSMGYYRNMMMVSLYNSMVGNRIREKIQHENTPYLSGSFGLSDFVAGYSIHSISVTAKKGEEKEALRSILVEKESVKRNGFLKSELDRVKENMLAGLELSFKQKNKVHNDSYISQAQSHFLYGNQIVKFIDYYNFVKQVMPTISVEDITKYAAGWESDENRTIIASGADDAKHLTKEEVLQIMDEVAKSDIEPYKETPVDCTSPLVKEVLNGSPVIVEKRLPAFDAVEWTLGNGAKIVFRKASYDKGQIALSSYSYGGTSLYDIDMLPAAQEAIGFVGSYGLGDYDAINLKKMLAGKIVSIGSGINTYTEAVSGSAATKDMETMFALLYLSFEHPRFDQNAHDNLFNRLKSSISEMDNDPKKIMKDTIVSIMSNNNPRNIKINEAYVDKLTMDRIQKIYLDRIKDASDFTFFIVGDAEELVVKGLVEKYLGSIKSYNRKENWVDHNFQEPARPLERKIKIKMEEPKATVLVNYRIYTDMSPQKGIYNNILSKILEIRYTENIREKEGGTYGVDVSSSASCMPKQEYSIDINFECDPQKADFLKSLVYKDIKDIAEVGPTAEELNKIISNIKKDCEQSKNHNNYWMSAIYNYYFTGVNMDDPRNYEQILDRIAPSDIQKYATDLFIEGNRAELIFL